MAKITGALADLQALAGVLGAGYVVLYTTLVQDPTKVAFVLIGPLGGQLNLFKWSSEADRPTKVAFEAAFLTAKLMKGITP